MLNSLELSIRGERAGHLVQLAPDQWVFRFDDGLGQRLSRSNWTLTGEHRSVEALAQNSRVWFRNLLPDVSTCVTLALRLGISVGNDFAILGLLGRDCQGTVSFRRPGEPEKTDGNWRLFTESDAARAAASLRSGNLTDELCLMPYLLPGDRSTLACRLNNEQIDIGGYPTSHIARLGRGTLEEAVENEAFCMRVAAALGLPVAQTIYKPGLAPMLLTQRSDRTVLRTGEIKTCHLEDFCQLAGLYPEQCFEREGGLAIVDCVNIIRRYSVVPALDIRAVLHWLVFAYLVGNGYAHAKSLNLVGTSRGPRLGQFSGLFSSHVYSDLSDKMAMYIGREDRPDWILPDRWREMAVELGLGKRYVVDTVKHLAATMMKIAPAIAAEFTKYNGPRLIIPRIVNLIAKRARQISIALEAERK